MEILQVTSSVGRRVPTTNIHSTTWIKSAHPILSCRVFYTTRAGPSSSEDVCAAASGIAGASGQKTSKSPSRWRSCGRFFSCRVSTTWARPGQQESGVFSQKIPLLSIGCLGFMLLMTPNTALSTPKCVLVLYVATHTQAHTTITSVRSCCGHTVISNFIRMMFWFVLCTRELNLPLVV